MINIKTFSPLQSGETYYYLGGIINPVKTELMFSDNSGAMYAMIVRRDFTDPTKYFILEKLKLNGFNNGTNYDYRLDLANYIKIVHSTDFTIANHSGRAKKWDIPINDCEIRLVLSTNDPITENYSIINSTLGNGQLYITNTDINSLTGNKFIDYWIFRDHAEYNLYFKQYLFTNALYWVTLGINTGRTLDYVRFYDKNNSLINFYGTETDAQAQANVLRHILFQVPSNAYKMLAGYVDEGTSFEIEKYVIGCATNQYFWLGSINPLDSLECTMKREYVREVVRDQIKLSNKTKNLKIVYQDKYVQNVGLKESSSWLASMIVAPFIFEIDSYANRITSKYTISNTTYEGNWTKKLSERNQTIELVREAPFTRYTNFENNFYA